MAYLQFHLSYILVPYEYNCRFVINQYTNLLKYQAYFGFLFGKLKVYIMDTIMVYIQGVRQDNSSILLLILPVKTNITYMKFFFFFFKRSILNCYGKIKIHYFFNLKELFQGSKLYCNLIKKEDFTGPPHSHSKPWKRP